LDASAPASAVTPDGYPRGDLPKPGLTRRDRVQIGDVGERDQVVHAVISATRWTPRPRSDSPGATFDRRAVGPTAFDKIIDMWLPLGVVAEHGERFDGPR